MGNETDQSMVTKVTKEGDDNALIRKNVMLRKGDWRRFKSLPVPGSSETAEYSSGKEGRVVSYHIREAMRLYLKVLETEGSLK